MLKLINKLVHITRAHQNTWGRVSQAQKRVWKNNEKVQNFRNIWHIWHGCQQMGR